MNLRFVYLLVAIVVTALGASIVSDADRDADHSQSADSSDYSDDSDVGEYDSSHVGHHHHQTSTNEAISEAEFSDSDDFSGIDIELAPQGNALEAFDVENRYERVFGNKSEPLEPEEAVKMLKQLKDTLASALNANISSYDRMDIDMRSMSIPHLLHFDAVSRDCNFRGTDMDWILAVYNGHKTTPALQPYLKSRRERLFESCRSLLANKVHRYASDAINRDMYVSGHGKVPGVVKFLKKSLASVPDDVVLKENFLVSKSDQVSAALSEVYYFNNGGKSFLDKNKNYFKNMFTEFAWELIARLPTLQIIPRRLLDLALEHDAGQVLDRRVIDWLKVQRISQQILVSSSLAADIVYAYNESVRAKKRAAKKKCKGISCFPGFGAKATRIDNRE